MLCDAIPTWSVDLLKTLLPATFVAIVTAVISVNLAIRRFRQEKWWEMKLHIYSETIETLHRLKKFGEEHLNGAQSPDGLSDEKEAELRALWKDSSPTLDRLEDLASFQLSRTAVDILANYRRRCIEARDLQSAFEWADEFLTATKACLDSLKAEAKSDLRIK